MRGQVQQGAQAELLFSGKFCCLNLMFLVLGSAEDVPSV